jgi:RHS repeat-associated protein
MPIPSVPSCPAAPPPPLRRPRLRMMLLPLLLPLLLRPGSLAAQGPPVLSTAPHNGDRLRGSFDATASYSTPAYISLDQPRSATLVYSSQLAHPFGLVQVNATDTSSVAPAKMSIRLKDASGAWVTFTTGTEEIFYNQGVSGTSRLAAQWDASAQATGAYDYTLVVRSWRSDGSFAESTAPVRVLIRSEKDVPYGDGWSVAGLQRARVQADGSVVVTEGEGGIAYFAKNGTSYLSPPSDFSTLSYNGTNYLRTYPDGSKVRFYSTGRQEYVQDRFGNRTTFAHNSIGALARVTDPAGKQINFSYTSGKLSSITDAAGRVSTVSVDALNCLWKIVDPGAQVALQASYDAQHRIKSRTDRRGGTWGTAYDIANKLLADTLPSVTADGISTRPVVRYRSWEAEMLPASGKGTSAAPASRVVPSSMRAEVINPRGKLTTLVLDRFGAPTRIAEPLGRVSYLTRNAHSQVTRVTAPSGHQTDLTWTGPNLTRSYDRTTGRTVNLEYEPTFNEVSRVWGDTDPVWNYWSAGKLDSTRVGSSAHPVSKFSYDSRGRVTSARDPEGHLTTRHYAGTGMLNTDSARAGRRRTAYTYDGFGRVATARDPAEGLRSVEYDVLNRALHSVGALNDTTSYTYDALFPTQVRDAKLQTYGATHNALGWTETDTDPNAKQRGLTYDKNGNVTSWTNRRGQSVSFTYDDLNQLRSRTADGKTTTFYTDPDGRFITASNAESTDTIKFDVLGRPTHEISVRGGTRYVVQSTWDKRNLRTQLQASGPWTGAKTIGYRYNSEMQLDTLIDLAGGRTRLGYNADHQLASLALPTGMTISLGYPSTHRSGSIRYSVGAVDDAFGQSYRHNPRREVMERVNVYGDSIREHLSDAQGQLTGFTDRVLASPSCTWDPEDGQVCTGTRTLVLSEAYGYDKVGNPTHQAAVVGTGNRLTRFKGYTLEYDADGNVTRRYQKDSSGTIIMDVRFFWNSLNQLDSLRIAGSCTVPFGYDGFGRKVRRGCASDPAAVTHFLYEGDDLLMELDSNGAPVAEYTYYPGTDRPHSLRRREKADSVFYYATDFPGNVVGLVSSSNQVVNRYRYRPFGSSELASGPVRNDLRFHGAPTDLGLYFLRNRWYDPTLERFLSEDPIGLAGGINPYRFVGNSPANFRDPSGLDHCVTLMGAAGYGANNVDAARDSHGCGGALSVPGVSTGNSSAWSFSTPRSSGYAPYPSDRGSGWARGGGSGTYGAFHGFGTVAGGSLDAGGTAGGGALSEAWSNEQCRKSAGILAGNLALDAGTAVGLRAGATLARMGRHGLTSLPRYAAEATRQRYGRATGYGGFVHQVTSLIYMADGHSGPVTPEFALAFGAGFVPFVASGVAFVDAANTCF